MTFHCFFYGNGRLILKIRHNQRFSVNSFIEFLLDTSQIKYFTLFNFLYLLGFFDDKLVTNQFCFKHFFAKWYPIKPVPPEIKIFFIQNFFV